MSEVRFGDLVGSGLLLINDGYRAKVSELGEGGPLFLRAGALQDDGFRWDGLDSFSAGAKIENKRGRAGDVVITTKGNSTGRVGWVPESAADFVYSPHLSFWRSLDDEQIVPRYLYYWSRSPVFAAQLRGLAFGTDMAPYLSLRDQLELRIDLPDGVEQRRIASVLGALDDLIETERSLAEAAIALVNAEFTRRFGDRPLSIDAGSLGRVIDCLHSKKPELVSGGRTLMQLNNIRDDGLVDRGPSYGISDSDYATWSRKFETRPWDLVITNVGRIGAVARIPDDYAVAIGRNMTALRPALPELDGAFLIASFLSSAVRSEIEARTDAGTVMSALNVRSIPHLRLQDSTPEERTAFHQVASPLLREADASLASILDLSRARDELLPLLMSGKVRVSEDLAVA